MWVWPKSEGFFFRFIHEFIYSFITSTQTRQLLRVNEWKYIVEQHLCFMCFISDSSLLHVGFISYTGFESQPFKGI